MKFLNPLIKAAFIPALCLSTYIHADEKVKKSPGILNTIVAAPNQDKPTTASNTTATYQPKLRWLPYWTKASNLQSKEALFSEINMGVGFLYFSHINGNLGNIPTSQFSMIGATPDKQGLSYNKTPVFEYILGYRFNNWFKFALSYQNQSNVFIQTRTLTSTGGSDPSARLQLGSDLQLNMLTAKFYFELPLPMIIKALAFSPYISGGPSASWQSWSNITDRIFQTNTGSFVGTDIPYRQKTVANIGAMIDAGFRIFSAYPNRNFSMTAGCKYNYWGQTRNLGDISQQSNFNRGLFKPFRIRSLYSFVPYIGLHWDFPTTTNYMIGSKTTETQDLFFTNPKNVYKQPAVTAQLSVGPNFIYFSDLRGNIAGQPASLFYSSGTSVPFEGRLSSIRAPLIEYLMGYRFSRWFEMGLSYQYQNETMMLSRWLPGYGSQVFNNSLNQFKSYLTLNGLMAKFSADLFTGIIQNIAFTPFIAAGAGVSWQSWTDIKIEKTTITNAGVYNNNFLYLRDKIVANGSWMADAGFKLRNANPNYLFSIVLGCRYNQWGQVRNIGDISQQGGDLAMGLVTPLHAKIMYSFSPYLGMQWDFPSTYTYCINQKPINRWLPYFTRAKNIQKRFSLVTQATVGAGFLTFDDIRGNIAGKPYSLFTQSGACPFEGRIRYNVTPVFEFVLGYRLFQWFQTAITYQTQKSIFISTESLPGYNATTTLGVPVRGAKNQLRAHLNLDAFLLKLTFELPYPMIFKGFAISPYIAASPGIGWQSWINMRVNRMMNAENTVGLSSCNQNIRQKIIANFVYMAEGGFRVRNATPNFPFSAVFGCKYIQWGQARNLGKMSQSDGDFRVALFQPFSIKVIGSIAPYAGLEWNF